MVIEHCKNGDPKPMGERFRQKGRMLPPGVFYQVSWIDPIAGRCFQIMEAPSQESLSEWTRHWDDLVDFEIIRVLTSVEYWSNLPIESNEKLRDCENP